MATSKPMAEPVPAERAPKRRSLAEVLKYAPRKKLQKVIKSSQKRSGPLIEVGEDGFRPSQRMKLESSQGSDRIEHERGVDDQNQQQNFSVADVADAEAKKMLKSAEDFQVEEDPTLAKDNDLNETSAHEIKTHVGSGNIVTSMDAGANDEDRHGLPVTGIPALASAEGPKADPNPFDPSSTKEQELKVSLRENDSSAARRSPLIPLSANRNREAPEIILSEDVVAQVQSLALAAPSGGTEDVNDDFTLLAERQKILMVEDEIPSAEQTGAVTRTTGAEMTGGLELPTNSSGVNSCDKANINPQAVGTLMKEALGAAVSYLQARDNKWNDVVKDGVDMDKKTTEQTTEQGMEKSPSSGSAPANDISHGQPDTAVLKECNSQHIPELASEESRPPETPGDETGVEAREKTIGSSKVDSLGKTEDGSHALEVPVSLAIREVSGNNLELQMQEVAVGNLDSAPPQKHLMTRKMLPDSGGDKGLGEEEAGTVSVHVAVVASAEEIDISNQGRLIDSKHQAANEVDVAELPGTTTEAKVLKTLQTSKSQDNIVHGESSSLEESSEGAKLVILPATRADEVVVERMGKIEIPEDAAQEEPLPARTDVEVAGKATQPAASGSLTSCSPMAESSETMETEVCRGQEGWGRNPSGVELQGPARDPSSQSAVAASSNSLCGSSADTHSAPGNAAMEMEALPESTGHELTNSRPELPATASAVQQDKVTVKEPSPAVNLAKPDSPVATSQLGDLTPVQQLEEPSVRVSLPDASIEAPPGDDVIVAIISEPTVSPVVEKESPPTAEKSSRKGKVELPVQQEKAKRGCESNEIVMPSDSPGTENQVLDSPAQTLLKLSGRWPSSAMAKGSPSRNPLINVGTRGSGDQDGGNVGKELESAGIARRSRTKSNQQMASSCQASPFSHRFAGDFTSAGASQFVLATAAPESSATPKEAADAAGSSAQKAGDVIEKQQETGLGGSNSRGPHDPELSGKDGKAPSVFENERGRGKARARARGRSRVKDKANRNYMVVRNGIARDHSSHATAPPMSVCAAGALWEPQPLPLRSPDHAAPSKGGETLSTGPDFVAPRMHQERHIDGSYTPFGVAAKGAAAFASSIPGGIVSRGAEMANHPYNIPGANFWSPYQPPLYYAQPFHLGGRSNSNLASLSPLGANAPSSNRPVASAPSIDVQSQDKTEARKVSRKSAKRKSRAAIPLSVEPETAVAAATRTDSHPDLASLSSGHKQADVQGTMVRPDTIGMAGATNPVNIPSKEPVASSARTQPASPIPLLEPHITCSEDGTALDPSDTASDPVPSSPLNAEQMTLGGSTPAKSAPLVADADDGTRTSDGKANRSAENSESGEWKGFRGEGMSSSVMGAINSAPTPPALNGGALGKALKDASDSIYAAVARITSSPFSNWASPGLGSRLVGDKQPMLPLKWPHENPESEGVSSGKLRLMGQEVQVGTQTAPDSVAPIPIPDNVSQDGSKGMAISSWPSPSVVQNAQAESLHGNETGHDLRSSEAIVNLDKDQQAGPAQRPYHDDDEPDEEDGPHRRAGSAAGRLSESLKHRRVARIRLPRYPLRGAPDGTPPIGDVAPKSQPHAAAPLPSGTPLPVVSPLASERGANLASGSRQYQGGGGPSPVAALQAKRIVNLLIESGTGSPMASAVVELLAGSLGQLQQEFLVGLGMEIASRAAKTLAGSTSNVPLTNQDSHGDRRDSRFEELDADPTRFDNSSASAWLEDLRSKQGDQIYGSPLGADRAPAATGGGVAPLEMSASDQAKPAPMLDLDWMLPRGREDAWPAGLGRVGQLLELDLNAEPSQGLDR